MLVYEQLIAYDWAKGLAGSGQIDFGLNALPWEAWGPELAESYKIPEIGTWIFQIRKGVHFALNPANEASRLMNGRELTADDVVYNVWRLHTDPTFPNAAPRRSIPATAKATTAEKTGPWEVTIKTPVDPWIGFFWITYGGCSQKFFAPEVIKKYGNVNDWRNAVGTGAFMVTDLVEGSAATFIRNPNYWGKNKVGPGKGNQLPYVDTVKVLIVPDNSTRLAAMRTGRADWVTAVESEDGRGLIKNNSKLTYKRYLPAGIGISMRIEKTDLPFKDKRVRQALMMATDFESMKNDLYVGDAEILIWPVAPTMERDSVPLNKLPEPVQALYKYNPEKAKQLLAEAGYPKGFKTRIMVENTSNMMDPASVYKAMWAKVGVDVEIQPRETTVFNSTLTARTWEEMVLLSGSSTFGTSLTNIFSMSQFRGATLGWVDQVAEDTFQEMQKYMFLDMPKADEIFRKFVPYALEQAYVIPRPTPYSYTLWQPWVKNYYGETDYARLMAKHVWIDQDLKEKMTGRR